MAGFLAFTPTSFAGVAQLGLIAGSGMLIAFFCSVTFLPAFLTVFRPGWPAAAKPACPGSAGWMRRWCGGRLPVVLGFAVLAVGRGGRPAASWPSTATRCTPRMPTPRRCAR